VARQKDTTTPGCIMISSVNHLEDKKQNLLCPLKIHNNQGLIFSSSIIPISGTVNMDAKDKFNSFEILILDKNSNEILRKSLRSDEFDIFCASSFTWDLKSKFN
jgi:hypothetical protein